MAVTDFSRTIVPVLKEGSTTLDTGAAPAVLGNTRVDLSVALVAATPNQEHDIEINSANIQMLWIQATVACTLYTNAASGGSPDDTIALTPNVPVHFSAGTGQTNPFVAAAVTKVYVTVPGAVAGVLKIFCIVTT